MKENMESNRTISNLLEFLWECLPGVLTFIEIRGRNSLEYISEG